MLRVLVVDDSKFMAKAMKSIVEKLGFDVVAVGHDGQQGLECFLNHRPDVTLLDVTMPNMCGVECLTRIKQADADARVVMLSAIQDQEIVDECLQIGASSFLQKPIRNNDADDLERLRSTIELAAKSMA